MTQLIIVFYNGKHNVYEGKRNRFELRDCPDDDLSISEEIKIALHNLTDVGGYVIVKCRKQMYLCEKNNKNPKGYDRIDITYHPLQEKFTI